MSMVARSSVLGTGVPQSAQKRTPAASSLRQVEHLAILFPLQDTSHVRSTPEVRRSLNVLPSQR